MLEPNMVNFQTDFEKGALPEAARRQGYFFKNTFENGPSHLAAPRGVDLLVNSFGKAQADSCTL